MISRRLFGIGVLAMAGDGLVRPLNAPPGVQAAPGVQPGVDTGVEYARIVIVFGPSGSVSGVFVYPAGSTPGAGNAAVESISNASVDPYGNAIQPGIMSQIPGGAFVSLFQGELNFSGGSTIEGAALGNLVFTTPGEFAFLGGPVNSTGGTAADPTIITTDTWHSPGLLNGWADAAGFGGFRYQLTTHSSVRVVGTISATAASATTFFTLSGVYVPTVANGAAVGCTGGAPAGAVPQVRWDASGNLSIVNAAAVPVAQSYFIDADIPLD